MTNLMQFRKYDQQQKTIELTTTKYENKLKNHMTTMEKIVINLSEGSWVSEKTIYTLIVEPAPAFLGRGVAGLPKIGVQGLPPEKNFLFCRQRKNIYTLLPIVQPWTSDNNYSTKLVLYIPYYSIWSAADPCRSCRRSSAGQGQGLPGRRLPRGGAAPHPF